jgi:large subunit ribosomal protein L15
MNLSDVRKARIRRQKKFLAGRGRSSGLGKTCGVGGRGQWGRRGMSQRAYYEGGQMPLIRRLPKRGFSNNAFKAAYELVAIGDLNRCFADGDVVDEARLREAGLIRRHDRIKVTANGPLSRKLTVRVHRITKAAAEAIAKAGGKAEALEAPKEPPKKPAPPAKAETKGAPPASKPEEKKKKADEPKKDQP